MKDDVCCMECSMRRAGFCDKHMRLTCPKIIKEDP
jgi:hypothetical protein